MLTQAFRTPESLLRKLGSVLVWIVAGSLLAIAGALLVLRLWIWPMIPDWQARAIAALEPRLAEQGLSLRVGQTDTAWKNWITPSVSVRDIQIVEKNGQPLLSVRDVEARLGLRSLAMLWHFQPVFSEITIRQPFVVAERNSGGDLRVGGFLIRQDSDDAGIADWLLRQGRIRADSAEVIWRDQRRQKTARLTDVSLSMKNFLLSHSWALKATPPSSLGETFAFQGDFRHAWSGPPSRFLQWGGEAFVQFDRVNLAELFGFIHLPAGVPLAVQSGQGALRAWLEFDRAQLSDLTLDVDLSEANFSWGKARRPMLMEKFAGRIRAQLTETRQRVELEQVILRSRQLAETMNVPSAKLQIDRRPDSEEITGIFSAASVDLVAAMWWVEHLPFPAQWKQQITELAPRGQLQNFKLGWKSAAEELSGFQLETDFASLTLAPGKDRPGFRSLSGSLSARESGGELRLKTKSGALIFPGIFSEPELAFDALESDISWSARHLLAASPTTPPSLSVQIRRLAAENADLKADITGRYDWVSGQGPGRPDLSARIARVKPERVARYTPLVANAPTREWLKTALRAGKPYSGTVELAGDLKQFPFRDPGSGKFLVKAKAESAVVQPAAGWPLLTQIDADVEFDRHQFRLTARNAKLMDLSLSEVKLRIEDMQAPHEILQVDGGLSGDLGRLIDAINQSPVKAMLRDATAPMTGRGPVQLGLGMTLDLTQASLSKISGKASFSKSSLRPMPILPEATNLSGGLTFNETGIQTMTLQGTVLGGAVTVSGKPSGEARTAFAVDGEVRAAGLEAWLAQATGLSLKNSFSGATRYRAQIDVGRSSVAAVIQSSLSGLSMDLPAPFKKSAPDDWGLRIEFQDLDNQPSGLPSLQRFAITSNQPKISARATITPGKRRETNIELDSPMAAGQLTIVPAQSSSAAPSAAAQSSATSSSAAQSSASSSSAAQKSSRTPRTASIVRAKLSRLWLESQPSEQSSAPEPTKEAAQEWPTLDAVVEDFRVGERQWGRLELQASPVMVTRSWEILRFSISNPDGVLTGQGQWVMLANAPRNAPRSRTSLNVELQLKNGGGLLARSGHPNLVKATSGKIEGKLDWPGSPVQFSGASLNGNLVLNLENGQFLKTEPGLGRLVGVLNLQSLPSRIKLDFRDVFSEGFVYERIRGDIQFAGGRASTENLRIIGVQASVILGGTADLAQETQDLRVLVLPELNAGLASLGYAALVNPAIGLGTFIAQYILRNPVRELLSYEYRVTGPWKDPRVEPIKRDAKATGPEIKAVK